MRPSRAAGCLLVVSALLGPVPGCRERPQTAPRGQDGGAAALGDGGTAWTVSEAQVAAYARYQRAMVDVYDALFRELERLGPARLDAGSAEIPPQVKVVERQALAEEQARAEAGLSDDELSRIEPLVLEVLNARALARSLDAEGQLKELEAMRDQLQGDARLGMEQTIEDLRAEQAEAAKLTALRAKYGDLNVDRVLAQEAELQRNHALWLSRISGARRQP